VILNNLTKKTQRNLLDYILLIIIFIYCLQMPIISRYIILLGIPIIIFTNPNLLLKKLTNTFLLLGFLSSYYLIIFWHGIFSYSPLYLIINIFSPIILYLCGLNLSNGKIKPLNVLIISTMGFIIFANLSVIFSFLKYSTLFFRDADNFWTGIPANSPYWGIFLSLGIAYLNVIFLKIKKINKILLITISTLSIISILTLATRSPIYAGVLSITTCLIIYLKKEKEKKSIKSLITGIVLFLFIFIVITNFFSFGDYLFGVERISETGLDDTGRTEHWFPALKGIFKYPLGGQKTILNNSYAHNFWLDIGWYAGIIPIIFILIFQFKHIKIIYKNIIENKVRYLEIGIFIAILVSYMIEPLFQASPVYFSLTIFLIGYYGNTTLNKNK